MRIASLVLAAALAATLPARAQGESAGDAKALRLANDHGCATCHEITPSAPGTPRLPPLGPPWSEIAARYRGDAGAEDELVQAIVRGTAGRHWKSRSGFDGMSAQGDWVDAADARRLVRWILATPERPR